MSRLEIETLGTWQGWCNAEPISKLPTGRLQTLWIRLLLNMDKPLNRRQLAFDFWLESTDEQALSNLRKLIHDLRRILPTEVEPHLEVQPEFLTWHSLSNCTVDAVEFERLVGSSSPPDWEDAVRLYRGPFLAGQHDEFVIQERERLHQLYIQTLGKRADRAEHHRQFDVALTYAERLVQADPLSDESHARVMRLHLLKGNPGAARRQLKNMESIYQAELGVAPSAAVYDLLKDAASAMPLQVLDAAPLTSTSIPMIGRLKEWAHLVNTWQLAAATGPKLVVLEGEAGIGKTRLTEEFLRWVQTKPVTVRVARCHASSTEPVPYDPVLQWLKSVKVEAVEPEWLAEISRLIPGLPTGNSVPSGVASMNSPSAAKAFFETLARVLVGDQPTVIVLDDVQWSDIGTLQTVEQMLRVRPASPLMLIATLRTGDQPVPDPVRRLLSTAAAGRQLVSIRVPPLSPSESEQLVATMGGLPSDSARKADAIPVYQASGGNPLAIQEVMQALQNRSFPADVQTTVHELMMKRLSSLAAEEQKMADLLAVFGKPVPQTILLELMAPAGEDSVIQVVEELIAKHVLAHPQTGVIDFYHPTMREAAVEGLSEFRKATLHAHIADVLRGTGQDQGALASEIAHHLEAAGRVVDSVPYYFQAAESAARVYAHEAVLQFCARVIAADAGRVRLEALSMSAQAYRMLGEWKESEAAYRKWLDLCGPSVPMQDRASHDIGLGNALRLQARYDEAITHLERALNLFEMLDDHHGMAQAHGNLGIIYQYLDDFERCAYHLRQNIELDPSGADAGTFTGIMGNLYYAQDRFEEAQTFFRSQLHAANESGNRTAIAKAFGGLTLTFVETGNFKTAFHTAAERIQTSRSIGDRVGLATAIGLYGRALWKAGYLDESICCSQWALRELVAVRDTRQVMMTLSILGADYAEQGHGELALWALEGAERLARKIGNQSFLCDVLYARATLYGGRGDFERAESVLLEAMQVSEALSREHMNLRLQILWTENQVGGGKMGAEEARSRLESLVSPTHDRIAEILLRLAQWELCGMEASRNSATALVSGLIQISPVPRFQAWADRLGARLDNVAWLTPELPDEVREASISLDSMRTAVESMVGDTE